MCDRIIVLIDMDCFYCQVETRYDSSLKGKPMAVVQYNQWQGGGIIAVNYEARAFGVTRHVRGNEAKKKCPEIVLVHVPSIRGKADLTRYREAGKEVVDVLCQFCDTVQRASVDEAYLDITNAVNARCKEMNGLPVKPDNLQSTFIVGCSPENSNDEDGRQKGVLAWLNRVYESDLQDETAMKLTVAALFVEEMRAAVYEHTGFHCSAGIAHNKILAKLACGIHKPQRQTILPQSGVPILYSSLPLTKIRGLGGKFGELVMKRLNVTFMSELSQFSEVHLQKAFDEKSGSWLFNIAQGLDDEVVTSKLTSKSIGCCKKFPGKLALSTKEMVEHWLGELVEEVAERLEKELLDGNRKATQFVVSYMQTINGQNISGSRCGILTSYKPKDIVQDAMELLKRTNTAAEESLAWFPPLKFLGISAGKFSEKDSKTSTIENFFKLAPKKDFQDQQTTQEKVLENRVPVTPENNCKEEKSSKSSGKNSFLMRFFKQEGLIRTPSSIESVTLPQNNDKHHSKLSIEKKNRCTPTGTSQQASTSKGCSEISDKTLHLLRVDESSNDSSSLNPVENWVSPGEIFPNLDEVDSDVAALLPSPLQRQLSMRLQKHQELRNSSKNKGLGKGKCRKSLIYDSKITSITENQYVKDLEPVSSFPQESRFEEANIELKEKEDEKMKLLTSSQIDIFASDSPEIVEPLGSETKNTSSESSDIANIPNNSTTNEDNCKSKTTNSAICDILGQEDICDNLKSNGSNISENEKETSDIEESLKELCPHCNHSILLQEYPEHLDFHVAEDLDKEINKPVSISLPSKVVSSSKSPLKDTLGKRKRGKHAQKQRAPASDKKIRSITNFFAPVQ